MLLKVNIKITTHIKLRNRAKCYIHEGKFA